TSPLGNGTSDGAKAVYKNQLTGDYLFGIDLDMSHFVLKQSDDFTAYYPQLKVFTSSDKVLVRNHALSSVENNVLFGQGTPDQPYIIYSSFDLRALGLIVQDGFDTHGIHFNVDLDAYINYEIIKDHYIPIGNLDNPFNGVFDGK